VVKETNLFQHVCVGLASKF